MKRIFLSLSMLTLVGSIAAIGSTGAFFSDTETSTGNIFTAGSINLLIDHSFSTYNDSPDLVVVSDPSATFTGDDGSGSAVNLSVVNAAWSHTLQPTANWIWATDPVVGPTTVLRTDTFTRTFDWTGPVPPASAILQLAADNTYSVTLNGHAVGSNPGEFNYGTTVSFDVTNDIQAGTNTLVITVGNLGVAGTDPTSNPAGLIFELVVHGQQTFGPTDLTNQTFFNFNDVKPQDHGRDVISMHVSTNDAWSCMVIKNIQNNENDLIPPEAAAGDITPGVSGIGGGELGQNLHLFLWHDLNGDGNYNPPIETPITGTLATPTTINLAGPGPIVLPVHDSTTNNGPLLASTEDDVGSAWCAGTLSVDPGTGAISCDGSSVSNNSQTDSTLADLEFYATQARNQPNFTCAGLGLAGDSTVTVRAADLDPSGNGGPVSPATAATDGLNKWFMYNDDNDTVDNTIGSFVVGPALPPHGNGSVEFTLGSITRKNIATYQFSGTTLASITQLGYGAYSHSGVSGPNESPFFNFNIDFTNTNAFQGRLVYVPSANEVSVPQDTWNTFDMISGGNALWTWSHFASNGNKWPDNNTNQYRTWNDIKTAFPNAKVLTTDPWLGIRVGEPGPSGYTGDVDFFKIATGGPATVYDFEN